MVRIIPWVAISQIESVQAARQHCNKPLNVLRGDVQVRAHADALRPDPQPQQAKKHLNILKSSFLVMAFNASLIQTVANAN